jgi:hypothetical protein
LPVLHKSAEPVEKVEMAIFNNFGIVKNQEMTSRRMVQKRLILGFSTASQYIRDSQGT